ncbi:MAG: FHA domain-containing protein [Nannocystaceae bacterium]
MAIDARPFLRQRSGPEMGRVHPLIFGDNLVGRDAAAEVFLDRADVSRRHALVRVDRDGVVVEDLGSKNGVLVDGEAIAGPTALAHGAAFQVGDAILEVSHPGAQVAAALARAGETTVTRAGRRRGQEPGDAAPSLSIRWPVLATILFAAAVVVLLWSGAEL